MSIVDAVVAHVLQIEISLYHTCARLEGRTDTEALHDLRINVRRLRSLLKPLRGRDGVDALDQAAAAVGQLTTPVRDLEVLADELRKRGLSGPASTREAMLASHYVEILQSTELRELFARLDAWPEVARAAEREGELRQLDKLLRKRLRKQMLRLQEALTNMQHDPHRIRLLVKRNRYAADAYPQHSPISPEAVSVLKAVQSSLGAWHDRYQWSLRSCQESDLEPLRQQWQSEAATALEEAESTLLVLADLFISVSQSKTNGPGHEHP